MMLKAYLQTFLMVMATLIVSMLFKVEFLILIGITIMFQLSVVHHALLDLFFESDE